MFESIIMLLIYICLAVAVGFLIIWVLGQIGVPLPAQVIKIMWVIVALICILLLWRVLGPSLSGGHLLR
jgi:hypothetical protein